MNMSRVILDTNRRETLRALAAPQRLHGAIESCFSGEHTRRLWRLDWLQDRCCLLLVSEQRPNLMPLVAQFGTDDQPGEIRDYQPFLDRLQAGDQWRFRLCGNPVHAVSGKDGGRGRLYAHVTVQQQKKWLLDRAEKNGFSLADEMFDVVQSRWMDFTRQDKNRVVIHQVTFEGMLTVTDATLLRQALTQGIGKEKAYGCGLLTLVSAGR